MLWYGSSRINKLFKLHFKNKKKYLNKRIKKVCFFLSPRVNYGKIYTRIHINPLWKVSICENKHDDGFCKYQRYFIYLYSPEYFFLLALPTHLSKLNFEKKTNVIFFQTFTKNNCYSLFWNFFRTIFFSFSQFFFKKLKVKGKGYYIFKNTRNTIAMQFGYSHKLYIYTYFLHVKFLTKTSVLLFGINKCDLINNSLELYRTRPQNIFTSKGVRFSKQIIYRKPSKVSN